MEKLKIGIPRALLYYKYGTLWTNFLTNLGMEFVLSPETNKEILESGSKLIDDESCLATKIYMGHVSYLVDKCDLILIPRIICLKKNEKLCTNFSCLYDLVRNVLPCKILHYNIDINKNEDEFYAFVTLGLELGFSYRKSVSAYRLAKEKEKLVQDYKLLNQNKLLLESTKTKVLLSGHPYNLYDSFIGKKVINILEEMDVDLIYSDIYDGLSLKRDLEKVTKRNYWTYSREQIAATSYYSNKVDGIILITAFPCGPDSLSNEMILRNLKTNIINLVIDENSGDTGLVTRIESFIDIIKEKNQ